MSKDPHRLFLKHSLRKSTNPKPFEDELDGFSPREQQIMRMPFSERWFIREQMEKPMALCGMSRDCALAELRKSYPDHVNITGVPIGREELIAYSKAAIDLAISICWHLDFYCMMKRLSRPFFLEFAARFHEPRALREVHALAWHRISDRIRGKRPVYQHEGDEELMLCKEFARAVRELRRIGASPAWAFAAVQLNFPSIKITPRIEQAIREAIRDTVTHPDRFTSTDRMRHLSDHWLALQLWESGSDGREACRRLYFAESISDKPVFNLSEENDFPQRFVTVWFNFRNKRLKPGRESLRELPNFPRVE